MKDIYKYCFGLFAVILFGLFVYPTLYQYDKLDQRLPVKINRITGAAEILTAEGWVKSGDYNTAANEMKQYKDEIINQISTNREQLKLEVINEIKDDIVGQVKADIESTRIEIEKYKAHELDSTTYFTVGDTKETVRNIMGPPDTVSKFELSNEETWYFDLANVKFKNGKVEEWRNSQDILRVR